MSYKTNHDHCEVKTATITQQLFNNPACHIPKLSALLSMCCEHKQWVGGLVPPQNKIAEILLGVGVKTVRKDQYYTLIECLNILIEQSSTSLSMVPAIEYTLDRPVE